MEINVADLAGSLGGGGRYDNLVGMFLGQSIPACGFSLGLERILVVMGERGMFPASAGDDAGRRDGGGVRRRGYAARHARGRDLRGAGCACSSTRTPTRSASRSSTLIRAGFRSSPSSGGDEIANGTVTVKHLAAQTQHTYDQAAAGAAILEELKQRG